MKSFYDFFVKSFYKLNIVLLNKYTSLLRKSYGICILHTRGHSCANPLKYYLVQTRRTGRFSEFLNENMVLVLSQLILTIVFLMSQQMFMKNSADGVERF